MATRNGNLTVDYDGSIIALWEGLAGDGDDVGSAIRMGPVLGLCVQFVGTNGNDGAFQLEGSNDGLTWGILHDLAGNAISSKTATSGVIPVAERPLYYRPVQTEGEAAVTDVDCYLVGQRARS
jgi:hypothetical protein